MVFRNRLSWININHFGAGSTFCWVETESLPLFLVKTFGSKGDLKTSDAPISLSDIPKTVLSELGFGEETQGTSIFDINNADSRSRRFLHHDWEWDFWKHQNYEQPMREYMIVGYPWLDESWHSTNKVFTTSGVRAAATYRYGEIIQFGKDGNYLAYEGDGWSCPNEQFTSSEKLASSITIPVIKPKADIQLKATFMTYIVPGKVDKQLIKVFCNDKEAGEWLITERAPHEHSILIPIRYITDDLLKISFKMPDAVSPYSIGLGTDKRPLGIAIFSMTLMESASPSRK